MAEEKRTGMPHNLVLENRRKLSISGVLDVDSFDESTIIVNTEMGELTIQGQDLHINNLSIETGEMCIEGSISTLHYSEIEKRSGGFFSKVFR
ncbi:MAG TPA: sporulation protein YabP [Clostridiales bacterium]|nr:sporulation protein YabP [Clostridiales bacterium]HPU66585.1 sporulation protein YabP [Clostridiales bacterium]HQD71863.1 sporulation protein YabP [Clostridiales bacterium]HXK82765.1 sporulation protein YabP [Clostridiales bacterium]